MNTRYKIAFALYALAVLASVGMGLVYLLTPRWMPYHAAAVQTAWEELTPGSRVLYLASLKIAGAGFLTTGLALGLLLAIPFRRGERWARWAIPIIGLIFWTPNLYATIVMTARTPATAPWYGPLGAILILIAGHVAGLGGKR
jgi:hypothetical protein